MLLTLAGSLPARSEPPAEKKQPVRLDRYGDPLPEGAIARLGTLRWRHHDDIFCLALSPDEKIIASAGTYSWSSLDHAIRLWDMRTGKQLHELTQHGGDAKSLFFSPDGKTLASGGGSQDASVRLWDVATGKELRLLGTHRHPDPNWGRSGVHALAFSPDGRLLASTGEDGTARLWEAATGKELRRWRGTRPLAFSRDGKILSCGGHGGPPRVCLLDVATGKELLTLNGHRQGASSLLFCRDGQTIITAAPKVLAPAADPEVRWWDRSSGKELRRVPGTLIASSGDGRWLAIADAAGLGLMDGVTGKEVRRFPGKPDPYPAGTLGALSADGKRLIRGIWNTIRFWETHSGKEVHLPQAHTSTVTFVGFSADGKRIVSAGDEVLRIWDTSTGNEMRQLQGHQRRVVSAALVSDRKTLASGSPDGSIRLWDLDTGKEVRRISVEAESGPLVTLSADGQTLAAIQFHARQELGVSLWNVATGERLRQFSEGNWAHGLSFTPDGKKVASLTTTLCFWDAATGNRLGAFPGMPNGAYSGLAFSPDGRMMATAHAVVYGKTSPGIWEVASGQIIRRFSELRTLGGGWLLAPAACIAFSPDGALLAVGVQDRAIRLWEVASGRQVAQLRGHRAGITALAFSPDGRLLASGSHDTTVLVWDIRQLIAKADREVASLKAGELRLLWGDLRDKAAADAYQAIGKLVAAPEQTVPFLKKQLKSPPTERQIARLIADLDDARFPVRQRASDELAKLGRDAEPALRAALDSRPAQEVRKRLEQLLAKLPPPGEFSRSPEELRVIRAVQVLEYIGTPEAQSLLKDLAKGAPAARLTQEAKASLERLAKRAALR